MTKRLLIVIIILFSLAGLSFAQSASISFGVNWLIANQNADKSWWNASTTATPFNTTAATLAALSLTNHMGPFHTAGLAWLDSQTVDSVNFASSRLIARSVSGLDVTNDLNLLVGWKNSIDWAWGLDGEYSNDIAEIALALQALKAANYSDNAVLFSAINFLTTNQNPDGGWGFRPAVLTGFPQTVVIEADPSNAYVTSMVLRALSAYNSQFIVQTNITNAKAYLLTKQNTDGGFGSSPSNVYETALSIMSLIESGFTPLEASTLTGQASTTPLQNGINYLTTTQLPNGSWENDPYQTALALQALAAARPNLSLSSISLSKSMPQAGEDVTITATVNNTGLDSASGTVVRFFLGDPAAGGTQLGADQIIPSLAVSSAIQSSITASFTGIGSKTIYAVVDPDGAVSETSETDNKTSTRLWVATGADLAVYSEDLKPTTYVPASGTAFTLEYKVRNLGETASNGFDIALYDGDPASGIAAIQTIHISGLAGTEVRTGTIGVTLTNNGPHALSLVADSGQIITETSETNNTATVTVTVGGVQTMADLVVGMIQFTPSRPAAGTAVAISASVRNQGMEAANNFIAEIYDGSPGSGGVLIHSQTISLAAGAEQAISANWTPTPGIHDIYTVVDRTNGIIESDESNNSATARLMTNMVDINISATDLVFTPAHPVSGDSVVLSITAHNTGIKDTGPFNLALYDGDPATGGALIRTYPISNIPGDGKTTLSHAFTAIPWTYRFYAIADAENVVTEMYEENNQAVRSLRIKAPGEILGPDLAPVRIDIAEVATDPQTLAISGNALVTFQNKAAISGSGPLLWHYALLRIRLLTVEACSPR